VRHEIFESVRESLAPAHMGRPLEAIEARGRAYRRHRRLAGLGGIGLSVGLGLALVLPMTDRGVHRDDINGEPTVTAPQAGQHIELASFTLDRTAEGKVTVTFKEAAADPKALEKALADVGVTALVRVNEMCAGTWTMESDDVVLRDDASGASPSLTIDAVALPKTVMLSLTLWVDDTESVRLLSIAFSVKGSPVTCNPVGVQRARTGEWSSR